jgi:UDP-glucose-4-epimerase GalE
MEAAMHILVTGGAGYIGSHTAKALAARGLVPVTLDNLSTGHETNVKWGPLERGDVGDRALVRQVLSRYPIAGVIHFAASAYVGESVANPRKYFQNNAVASLALVEEALDAGIERIVFSSSCATYGVPDWLPVREDQPQRPMNPYGETKLFTERTLRAFGDAYGLRWTALRYFNAAGADPDGELGEAHDPETHLIPLAIEAALGTRPHLDILGTDYPTADGTAIRDFIHVSDLANAHVLALDSLLWGGPSRALNLGNGRGHSVREVVQGVERISGRCVPVRLKDRRPGDPPALVADASLARTALGWRPVHTALEDMIGSAWAWHARDLDLPTRDLVLAGAAHD